jgi:methionyl-tRNA synthetase
MSEQRRRYLVTSALPYANGPLHVGQISGAYLPADAFVRYLRARGEDVVYVCGTDDHGVPITLRAEREGKSPREVVDYWWGTEKGDAGDLLKAIASLKAGQPYPRPACVKVDATARYANKCAVPG